MKNIFDFIHAGESVDSVWDNLSDEEKVTQTNELVQKWVAEVRSIDMEKLAKYTKGNLTKDKHNIGQVLKMHPKTTSAVSKVLGKLAWQDARKIVRDNLKTDDIIIYHLDLNEDFSNLLLTISKNSQKSEAA